MGGGGTRVHRGAEFASFEFPAGWNPNGGQISKLTSDGLIPMATNLQFPTSVVYDAAGSIYTGSLTLGLLNKVAPGVLPYCEGAPNSVSADGTAAGGKSGRGGAAAPPLSVGSSSRSPARPPWPWLRCNLLHLLVVPVML